MKNNNYLKLAGEWVLKAQNDLKTAQIIYKEKGPGDTLCFHCHQAVEKYLKAYLVLKNILFEKNHQLWQLAQLCAKENKEFLALEE